MTPPESTNLDERSLASHIEEGDLVSVGDLLNELQFSADTPSPQPLNLGNVGSRQSPHSSDAERGVLCGILLDPDAFDNAASEGIRVDDFYHPAHATIFSAMQRLHQSSEPINTVTVSDELLRMQKLEQVGGAAHLAQLETLFPTSAHTSAYAKLVKDKSTLRRLIASATRVVQSAYRQDRRVVDVIDEAERIILEIRNDTAQRGVMPIKNIVSNAMHHLRQIYEGQGAVTGVASGFKDVDRITNGLQPGELIVIAARPSMGKTAFTLNIAAHVALNMHQPVAFFSLEMGAEQLVQRLLGAEARLDLSNLRRGIYKNDQYAELTRAAGYLSQAPLYIDETPSLSIAEMRNKARRMSHQFGVQLIVVDYLQLMSGPESYDNKATEVAEISKGLKSIARELKIPVIALSQLNRGVESRTDKRPMMSDLRESGAIEQDADIVAFLYREEYYLRDKTPEDQKGLAEVIVAKNRNGPTGMVQLRFFSNLTRFEDLDRHHDNYGF